MVLNAIYEEDFLGFSVERRAREGRPSEGGSEKADQRATGAAAAMAIDYRVLPWKKRPTFKAVKKCLFKALNVIETSAAPQTTYPQRFRRVLLAVLRNFYTDCQCARKGVGGRLCPRRRSRPPAVASGDWVTTVAEAMRPIADRCGHSVLANFTPA
jgi:hypothetical protein